MPIDLCAVLALACRLISGFNKFRALFRRGLENG
jgi:hypothetical protein